MTSFEGSRKPPRVTEIAAADREVSAAVEAALRTLGHDPSSIDATFVADMMRTSLKFLKDGADSGQLKLVTAAMKELRYAYRVFNRYRGTRKISIFGSARTPEDHPDYIAARRFGELIAEHGWMAITGAGNGIMKAGHEGPTRDSSFGLAIRLPSEQAANAVIDGDPKLINFRYFFTRKLMFTSNSHAIAVFPGGFGTQDELYEVLTLMQTGKSVILPIVLVEGAEGDYWTTWERFAHFDLLRRGWICAEDAALYRICATPQEAVENVIRFYRRYRSSRFVGDRLVIRLDAPLGPEQIASLEHRFGRIVKDHHIVQSGPLLGEDDSLELPRLHFVFTRRDYGTLRHLLDAINELPYEEAVITP
ncbi:MAG: LOG family protein [Phycisphaerae bacterium]|nr:LOG family protein [Phycisphaerae bacterium]